MPNGLVRTTEDEATWARAKAKVRAEYDLDEDADRFWKLVNSIYQKMKGSATKSHARIVFSKSDVLAHEGIGGFHSPVKIARPKKHKVEWNGIPLVIENPKDSLRHWKDSNGADRFTKMEFDYGEIPGTMGWDGDPLDVVVGPNRNAPEVYVVTIAQKPEFTTPDEQKCLLNFSSKDEALSAMLLLYDDPRFIYEVQTMGVGQFLEMVKQNKKMMGKSIIFFRSPKEELEKARKVREYYKRDAKGQLIQVREHWDPRDPAKPKQVTEQYVFGGQLEPEKQPRNVKPISFKESKPKVKEKEKKLTPLFDFGEKQKREAEEAKRQAEEAKRKADAKDPRKENLKILTDLLSPKGIHVRMGETSRRQQAIEMYGNTFAHKEQFQAMKGSGVWGEKNARGYFAWWTDHERIGTVIKQFGGKPYAAPERADTPGRGTEPTGRPTLSTVAPSGAGESPARRDGGDEPRSGHHERGSLPESPAPVRSGETEQPVGDASTSPGVSGGVRPERRDYRGYSIDQLIAVTSPESQTALAEGLDSTLKGFQQQTVRLATDAYRRGEKGFLLGDQTGTGKTWSGLGIIKQLKPTRALIVVPNQGIAQQWKEAAESSFNLSLRTDTPESSSDAGLFVMTYAKLRDLRKEGKVGQPYGPHAGGFDLCIFDEAHQQAMKVRQGGQTARLVQDVASASKFSVYSTATPFERPQDAQYLGAVGLWPRRRDAFKNWAAEHGVRWDVETIYARGGIRREVSKPKFIGTGKGKLHDMLRIRAALLGEGKGVFNELKIDQPMTTEFSTIPTEGGPFGEQVGKALKALDSLPPGGIFAAARVNLAKRLLDYVKLDAAVGDALAAAKEGKRVAVFVSNKSPFQFGLPDDVQEIEGLGAVAQQIRQAFRGAGLTGSLPSPTEYLANKLREQLGEKAVEEYTGDVSDAKRARIKKDFQQGKLQAIVASIAAGGTGLSLHDTTGNAPRHQVNIGLPWSGKDFFQLIGRTYREGTASPVTQHFLLANDPYEQRLAQIVAGKAESMGATVRGVASDKNVDNLAQFSVMGMFEREDEHEPGTLAEVKGEGWKKSMVVFIRRVLPLWFKKSEGPTVNDIHQLCQDKGIPWDNDSAFMDFTEQLTGKRHLDEMGPSELQQVYDAVQRRSMQKSARIIFRKAA